jgi:hypothetical protein
MRTFAEHVPIDDSLLGTLVAQRTPAERTILTSQMFASAREMLRGYLSEQHPDWTGEQVQNELLRRIHGAA